MNIDSEHPPNQKKTNHRDQNVAYPLARCLRIAKIKHAAIVAFSVQCLEEGWRFFVVQQPALAFDAATVAGERTIRPDHTMTRHDNSYRI